MTLARGKRLTGTERDKLVKRFGKLYEQGQSIRAIAASEGTSIGRARNLVVESGVQMRQRGGSTKKAGYR